MNNTKDTQLFFYVAQSSLKNFTFTVTKYNWTTETTDNKFHVERQCSQYHSDESEI